MIWKRHLTLDELNATSDNTMVAHLGIVYTRLGDDVLEAEMPVDTRTHQPFGLLHGGASAALAETLGSMAGFMMIKAMTKAKSPATAIVFTVRPSAARIPAVMS